MAVAVTSIPTFSSHCLYSFLPRAKVKFLKLGLVSASSVIFSVLGPLTTLCTVEGTSSCFYPLCGSLEAE